MHASWKGYLKLSLVSVPVAAMSASEPSGRPQFHQLHEACHSRIKYQKTCPIHGEVTKDEIVSGFEYAKGQYVVVDKDEIAEARGERERAINIEAVVQPGTIEPLFFTERSDYLVPDGKVALKPYSLLRECLAQDNLEAVGQGVLFGREEMVLLRPVEDILTLTALKYEAEVRGKDELDKIEEPTLKKEEVALTKTLLHSYEKDDFDIGDYTDRYAADLAKLIEAKVAGKEVVRPPAAEAPPVINLMDALKKSLAKKTPARAKKTTHRRRKSG